MIWKHSGNSPLIMQDDVQSITDMLLIYKPIWSRQNVETYARDASPHNFTLINTNNDTGHIIERAIWRLRTCQNFMATFENVKPIIAIHRRTCDLLSLFMNVGHFCDW